MCDPFKASPRASSRTRDSSPTSSTCSGSSRPPSTATEGHHRRPRTLPIRRLLLRNGRDLDPAQRFLLHRWLDQHPALRELYRRKEALSALLPRPRPRPGQRAPSPAITDRLALSSVPEIQTLRRTLMRWRREILAYFSSGLTNGMTEGFNNKAKLVKRRAYGYRSFPNYRLRLLNACA